MRQILTSLVLVGMFVAGFWPAPGTAEEPLEQEGQIEAIALPPAGFTSFTAVFGLTDPRGLVAFPPFSSSAFPASNNFRSGYYVVEKSLNRVSFAFQRGTPEAFAPGLSNPTDLVAPRGSGGVWADTTTSPVTNFLYVAEAGGGANNRISRLNNMGVRTTFANLPAAPERLAFSNVGGGSAFGDFLFVTLTDGSVVKVDPTGAVTSCLSGLSGPKGLVFAPGGGFRTTTLYVVQSTANKISKVDSACTNPVSDFATGLSAPVGLAASPALPWGPLDTTLYVANAGTRVDRVEKNGTVTSFASGFTQVDAVRFDSFLPVDDRLSANLRVVDTAGGATGAGTVVEVNVRRPSITLTLTGCNPCQAGKTPPDVFAISLTVTYNGLLPLPVEVKTGFQFPDGTPLNFDPFLGNNKHFETLLPPLFTFGPQPWVALTWPGAAVAPPGRYCYQASLTDPEIAIRSFANTRTCFVVLPPVAP